MAKSNVMTKAAKNDVLVVAQNDAPDYIKQNGQRGSENVGTNDIAIPRLEIIQGLSPAVKRGDPGYIKGAEIGGLINSISKKLYGDSVVVVPMYYTKQWLVWKARKYIDPKTGKEVQTEGGFLGSFADEMSAMAKADAEGGAPQIEVIDTPQHFCLLIDSDGEVEEIMIAMPKTKAKKSREWNSMVRMAGSDRFSRVYKISTVYEKNARGDFYNFEIALAGYPSKALYDRAERTYEIIAAGDRKLVMDVGDFETASGGVTVDSSEM